MILTSRKTRPELGASASIDPGIRSTCQAAQLAPALILLGLSGVGIFFAFHPKAEPVHVALLRDHPLPGLLKKVCTFRDVNHFYGFAELGQSGIPRPIRQQRDRP